jgi:hypothetical protein
MPNFILRPFGIVQHRTASYSIVQQRAGIVQHRAASCGCSGIVQHRTASCKIMRHRAASCGAALVSVVLAPDQAERCCTMPARYRSIRHRSASCIIMRHRAGDLASCSLSEALSPARGRMDHGRSPGPRTSATQAESDDSIECSTPKCHPNSHSGFDISHLRRFAYPHPRHRQRVPTPLNARSVIPTVKVDSRSSTCAGPTYRGQRRPRRGRLEQAFPHVRPNIHSHNNATPRISP